MNMFILLFGVYIFAMIALGYYGSKKSKDISSFSVSSGDVSTFKTAITFAACFLSAGTFLGVAGQGFAYGTTVLWFWASQWTTCGIALAVVAKGYRRMAAKMKSLSVPDWIADRYNSQFLRIFIALVSMLQILYVASQLVGVGIILNTMTGVNYNMGVIIGATVIMAYICLGGTYAHIYTNVAQGVLMLVISVTIMITGFFLFGNVFTEVPARLAEIQPVLASGLNPSNGGYPTAIFVVGMFVAHLWWAINPQLINKTQYLKKDSDIKKFILLNAVFMFLGGCVIMGGLYTRILLPEGVGEATGVLTMDSAIPTFITMVYPSFFASIFNVVVIAATMSTIDGILLYMSTVIGNTLYKESYIRAKRNRGETIDEGHVNKRAMFFTRVATIAVGCLAVPMAFTRPENLTAWLWLASGGILSATVGPIIVGIYSQRAGKQAAILGSVGGFAIYMFLFFSGIVPSVYLNTGIGGTASVLLTYAGTRIFPAMEQEDPMAVAE